MFKMRSSEGISTLPQCLEIIQKQKEHAYEELKTYQAKIAHLEEKEQYYIHAIIYSTLSLSKGI